MRGTTLLREAIASARGQKVSTTMVALIVAAMCITTLVTVGRTIAAESQVELRLEEAGSRQIEISDVASKGFLTPAVIDVLAAYDGIERAVGVNRAAEAWNHQIGAAGPTVPSRTVQGDLDDVAVLTLGRWPEPGEAIVSTLALDLLAMDAPVGAVSIGAEGRSIPIVGSFEPRSGFEDFDDGVLLRAGPGDHVDSLRLIAASASQSSAVEKAALSLLARPDPADLDVRSPATLAEVQAEVLGDLRVSNRLLVLLVLGAGAVLSAIVVLADVLLNRTDLGRRRALGAQRSALTLLVMTRTGVISVPAAATGSLAGLVALLPGEQQIDIPFSVAIAVLAALTAITASTAPAVLAAWQDPIRVLRTP